MDTYNVLLNGADIAEKYRNSDSEEEKDSLVMKIFSAIYNNLDKLIFIPRDEDFDSDFALFFYDKIPALLRNYNPKYSSFFTYLINYLKFATKSFIHKELLKKNKEELAVYEEQLRVNSGLESLYGSGNYDLYASENSISYGKDFETNSDAVLDINKNRDIYFSMPHKKRLIFLMACKSCLFLDDDMTSKVANDVGCPTEDMTKILEKLRSTCLRTQVRMNKRMTKRNTHYIKMKAAKKFADSDEENSSSLYLRSRVSHERNYKAWKSEKEKEKRQVKFPSNKSIGECLNISPSSIDRNLEKALKDVYN